MSQNAKFSPSVFIYILAGLGVITLLKRGAAEIRDEVEARVTVGRPVANNFNFSFQSLSATFNLSIPVRNNLPFDIPHNKFIGNIFYNNIDLGQVDYPLTTISAGANTNITAFVKIPFSSLSNSIQEIITNPLSVFDGPLRLKGIFISNGVGVDFEQKIKLGN